MSDDPTRATPVPPHGSLGPTDPRTDPATQPTMRPAGGPVPEHRPAPESPTVPTPADGGAAPRPPTTQPPAAESLAHSRTGVLWTGLILSALVLLFLLVFILQNDAPVRINFLGASGTLPTGVALLLAAIAGLLLIAIPGGLRILQLRRAARRAGRVR